ncbi:MAG: ExeM/NucH family extracellular endonuclease [Xanthomonadales bacterium]|nr:ExeM/NucH family extracellular endonuclease [Xanthomonadales bacterium]
MKYLYQSASRAYLQLAFFILIVVILAGCAGTSSKTSELSMDACRSPVTSIAAIQGSGKRSPLLGERHTVRGIVTYLQSDSGLYLEQIMADMDPRTSDAIFVIGDALPKKIAVGDLLQLSGVVTELKPKQGYGGNGINGGMTSLEQITIEGYCGHQQPLPAHAIKLPLSNDARESLEAMRVEINQELTVSDVYQLYKRRQITVSAGGLLITPTEVALPGEAADKLRIDNQLRQTTLQLPTASPDSPSRRLGDKLFSISGIISQNKARYLLTATEPLQFSQAKDPRMPVATDKLRVMSFNLLNLFNGDGKQGGFPTKRGAESHPEFIQQLARLVNAIAISDADIVALQELENDGYGPDSAIVDLVDALNQSMPDAAWRFARPATDRLGADVISVGLIYRSSRVKTIGQGLSLNIGPFKQLSRRPLAQRFVDTTSGGELLIAVNHFKSKGSCPKIEQGTSRKANLDVNQVDGQACWNQSRVVAAYALADWLNSLRNISGVADMLIIGDLNSYRQEDPIRLLRSRGWTEMVETFSTAPLFTFVYWGQSGTLDYAFASPTLKDKVSAAWLWNINSPYSPDLAHTDGEYRGSSDHDPVIVDIDFANNGVENTNE